MLKQIGLVQSLWRVINSTQIGNKLCEKSLGLSLVVYNYLVFGASIIHVENNLTQFLNTIKGLLKNIYYGFVLTVTNCGVTFQNVLLPFYIFFFSVSMVFLLQIIEQSQTKLYQIIIYNILMNIFFLLHRVRNIVV